MKKKTIVITILALACLLAFGGGVLASPAFPAGIIYPFGVRDQTAGILEVCSGIGTPGSVNIAGPTAAGAVRPEGMFLYSRTSTNWAYVFRQENGLQIMSSTGLVMIPNIPSSDPHVAGALYTQYGYLRVSTGK